ncbi:Sec7-domain-containing protein [Gonapodya prolifera JEL478]|uniref:Sec7-domain-containing protein n=1 Tax=Gonapodya prolifera (strain JEL478) TaxID=1344416 RepID=A0A139AHU3_GONPJ|nr:Sec7-domain-containing protein [Gonapodya prolifera JEL478]|eukprot:KXS16367.1 Sec7-domain-containing protein [Gonapodya prolifera JEL478]
MNVVSNDGPKSVNLPTGVSRDQWRHIIHAEVISVIAAMRRNQRWSLSGGGDRSEGRSLIERGGFSPANFQFNFEHYENIMRPSEEVDVELLLSGSHIHWTGDDRHQARSPQTGEAPHTPKPPMEENAMGPSEAAMPSKTNAENMGRGFEATAASPKSAQIYQTERILTEETSEETLLHNFFRLRRWLTTVHNFTDLDPVILLYPFLEVIRSGETTGPITGVALGSVEHFIEYEIIDPNHASLPDAMSALVHTVTHCKFEATDAVADEVVLSCILRLLRTVVQSDAGRRGIDDRGACECVEASFGMCFQGRVGEILRRSAEHTLSALVRLLFERVREDLPSYTPEFDAMEEQIEKLAKDELDSASQHNTEVPKAGAGGAPRHQHSASAHPTLHVISDASAEAPTIAPAVIYVGPSQGVVTVGAGALDGVISVSDQLTRSGSVTVDDATTQSSPVNVDHGHESSHPSPESVSDRGIEQVASSRRNFQLKHQTSTVSTPVSPVSGSFRPFSLPSALETMRALVSLIDVKNRQHTDSVHRVVALGLLTTAFEVVGDRIGEWINWGRRADKWSSRMRERIAFLTRTPKESLDPIPATSVDQPGENISASTRHQTESAGGSVVAESLPEGTASIVVLGSGSAEPHSVLDPLDVYPDLAMHIALASLISDDLCRHLFSILRMETLTFANPPTSVQLTLLQSALRCAGSLFTFARSELKVQWSFLLDFLMNQCESGVVGWDVGEWGQSAGRQSTVSTPAAEVTGDRRMAPTRWPITGEVRELILESFVQYARLPTFFSELYLNFDCDLYSPNHPFEDVIKFLAKHSFPDATPGGPVTSLTHQILCIEALILFLSSLVRRIGMMNDGVNHFTDHVEVADASVLPQLKARKKLLDKGADLFNVTPKDGVAFWKSHDFLSTENHSNDLATLLRNNTRVSKRALGDFLSKPANVEVLKAFITEFEFEGKRLDEALRVMLEAFRLPGESQLIERIMNAFAEKYHSTLVSESLLLGKALDVKTPDATFVLSYSIILLNTDQHNPQVPRRMTFDDFKRNTRGVNDGKDFSPEYLRTIYDDIRAKEIVMPEEHEGDLGFGYAWRKLQKRARVAGKTSPYDHQLIRHTSDVAVRSPGIILVPTTNVYDRDLFLLSWSPIVAAISYAFDSAEDDDTLQQAILGFHHCTVLASHFHVPEVLDSIFVNLSKSTGLLRDEVPGPFSSTARASRSSRSSLNQTLHDDTSATSPKLRPMSDKWVIEFGRNIKGQIAAVLMFSMATEFGNVLRDGWKNLLETLGNLFIHDLLPDSLVASEDFVHGFLEIPVINAVETPKQDIARVERSTGGLFSALGQILALRPAGEDCTPHQITEEDLLDVEIAQVCIKSCKTEAVFADSGFLEDESLVILVETLVSLSFTSPGSTSVAPASLDTSETNSGLSTKVAPRASSSNAATLPRARPTSAFFLNIIVKVSIQNRDRIKLIWPVVFTHLTLILSESSLHPALAERAAIGVLQLAIRLVHREDMADDIGSALQLLQNLPLDLMSSVVEQIMRGLVALIRSGISGGSSCVEPTLDLLSIGTVHPQASQHAIEAVSILMSGTGEHASSYVTPENFGEFVDLLIGFVASAGTLIAQSMIDEDQIKSNNQTGWGRSGSQRQQRTKIVKLETVQQSVQRAVVALDKLYMLHAQIPELVSKGQFSQERAWFEFWLPILSGLSQSCYHPSREIRQHGLTYLQRLLLSAELGYGEHSIDCFENVIFPLLDELLKLEVFRMDPAGMDETRMRAVGLLSKVFLQSLPQLSRWSEFQHLWTRILEYILMFLDGAGHTEYLREAVRESLKNMLLVVSTQGMFHSSEASAQHTVLWEATWRVLTPILPGLREELFPVDIEDIVIVTTESEEQAKQEPEIASTQPPV